jgi:hypothetical protein
MSICRLTYQENLNSPDKTYEFDNELDAQEFLDRLPSRVGVEITEGPLLFRLLNVIGAPLTNWKEIDRAVCDEFRELARRKDSEFDRSTTTELYTALHIVFKSTMDIAETTVPPDGLEKFQEARRRQYDLFIAREAMVGVNVSVETLDTITLREIAAGRMSLDNPCRQLAIAGMAEPHYSRDDLLALEEEAKESHQPPPYAPQSLWQRVSSWINK